MTPKTIVENGKRAVKYEEKMSERIECMMLRECRRQVEKKRVCKSVENEIVRREGRAMEQELNKYSRPGL